MTQSTCTTLPSVTRIPFMAGSSLPVTWRYPADELPVGSEIEEAMAVGYGGLERHGFHALESLQCIVERRRGGESGVAAVTAVKGDQIWQAEKEGKWDRRLLVSAVETFDGSADDLEKRLHPQDAAFYLIEYRDGLRGTVANIPGVTKEFAVACRLRQRKAPVAWWIRLEGRPHGHFEHLLRAIEHMIRTKQPAYPGRANSAHNGDPGSSHAQSASGWETSDVTRTGHQLSAVEVGLCESPRREFPAGKQPLTIRLRPRGLLTGWNQGRMIRGRILKKGGRLAKFQG